MCMYVESDSEKPQLLLQLSGVFQNRGKRRANGSTESGREERQWKEIPSHYPNSMFITKTVKKLRGSTQKSAHP